jgi:CRISPR-associated endonuclease Csn1
MSYSFELSRFLQKINNLSYTSSNKQGLIYLKDRANYKNAISQLVVAFAEKPKITYADIRKTFELSEKDRFKEFEANDSKNESKDIVNGSTKNSTAAGSNLLFKVLGKDIFNKMAQSSAEVLDEAAFCLTFYDEIGEINLEDSTNWDKDKEPVTIIAALYQRCKGYPELISKIIDDLFSNKPTLNNFKGTAGTSAKLCRQIIPFLIQGNDYYTAMKLAGYDATEEVIDLKSLSNPIVSSVLRESLKQIIHLIDETGSLPGKIHIELARDLGKSMKERDEISKGIKKRNDSKSKNRDIVAQLCSKESTEVTDDELLRYELYKEQGGCSPYSGENIEVKNIFSNDYQVDHILPRSRSADNSFDNKVLVETTKNQNKKNRTPFEWLSKETIWDEYKIRILSMKQLRSRKRKNLLNENFEENKDSFLARNLNDTQYISKLVHAYLKDLYSNLPGKEDSNSRYIFARPGALTAHLRKSWGLEDLKKDLDGQRIGDKHHAVDALVVACCDESALKKLTNSYQELELGLSKTINSARQPAKIKKPWPSIRENLIQALNLMNVSRREICKASGSLHNETFYSKKYVTDPNTKEKEKKVFKRTSIFNSTTKKPNIDSTNLAKIYGIMDGTQSPRSSWLQKTLEEWLQTDKKSNPKDPQGREIHKLYVCEGNATTFETPHGLTQGGSYCVVMSSLK